jgi:hypothetical protein
MESVPFAQGRHLTYAVPDGPTTQASVLWSASAQCKIFSLVWRPQVSSDAGSDKTPDLVPSMTDAATDARFTRGLRRTLQALALPGDALDALVPPGASVIGELVAETSFYAAGYRQQHPELPGAQADAQAAVVAAMDQFTEAPDIAVYQYAPSAEHPAWQAIRQAARAALDAFGWPREHPGSLDP